MAYFGNCFAGKKVLITGHTGFKGSWLASWLIRLGAEVVGFSVDVPTSPSHFEASSLQGRLKHVVGDVRDAAAVRNAVYQARPDFVFHLAAQSLVKLSYADPRVTLETNFGGTVNVLEALRTITWPCAAVLITSDKCYDNVEQVWGYRETDRLGGKDPYSASKGAAELAIRTYACSFFSKTDSVVRVAIGRAGNVIGGGDWAADRVVPDSVRAWAERRPVIIRNPAATRPWQHVLEPLSGYLALASHLAANASLNGEPFNFGPPASQNYTVANLLSEMTLRWPGATWNDELNSSSFHEAGLLKLCCDKAQHVLDWQPVLSFAETVRLTSSWYRSFYNGSDTDVWNLTLGQIGEYEGAARERGAAWAVAA